MIKLHEGLLDFLHKFMRGLREGWHEGLLRRG